MGVGFGESSRIAVDGVATSRAPSGGGGAVDLSELAAAGDAVHDALIRLGVASIENGEILMILCLTVCRIWLMAALVRSGTVTGSRPALNVLASAAFGFGLLAHWRDHPDAFLFEPSLAWLYVLNIVLAWIDLAVTLAIRARAAPAARSRVRREIAAFEADARADAEGASGSGGAQVIKPAWPRAVGE